MEVKELKIISGGQGIDTFIYFDGIKQDKIKWIKFEVAVSGSASCEVDILGTEKKKEGEEDYGQLKVIF